MWKFYNEEKKKLWKNTSFPFTKKFLIHCPKTDTLSVAVPLWQLVAEPKIDRIIHNITLHDISSSVKLSVITAPANSTGSGSLQFRSVLSSDAHVLQPQGKENRENDSTMRDFKKETRAENCRNY